jgi:UDPglucose 6-dehydrogenase
LFDADASTFQPTIIEEENKNEAYLLLESAEAINVKLKLPALARQINEDMVKHAVNLTQDALRSCGKTLRRSRVAVLGAANPLSTVNVFIKMLGVKGAKVSLYDPKAKKEQSDSHVVKPRLSDTVEGADCIVILSGQEQINRLNLKKLKALMKGPPIIVDLTGAQEPENVTIEGFIYCRLGRGIGK